MYLGKYAAHEADRRTTPRSAIAEAAHVTNLERNGDIVILSSYAPLLAKRDHADWNPDLIYFTNTGIFPTINYHVQKLLSSNSGDTYLESEPHGLENTARFAFSTVRDTGSGDIILKLVNGDSKPRPLTIELSGAEKVAETAGVTVLAGNDPGVVNDFESPRTIIPTKSELSIGSIFEHEAPPHSFTVIRVRQR